MVQVLEDDKYKKLPAKIRMTAINTGGKWYRLSLKEEIFCRKYLECTDAAKAAGEVYDVENPAAKAYYLLGKPYIQIRLQQLLQTMGFNDLSVAREHLKVINQDDKLDAKNKAIDMYYKIKGVYAPQKQEVTRITINEERREYIDNLLEQIEQ